MFLFKSRCSGVFITNFQQIKPVLLFITLNMYFPAGIPCNNNKKKNAAQRFKQGNNPSVH